MKILWHTPYRIKDAYAHGESARYPDPVWPEDWPVPPVGSSVYVTQNEWLKVKAIDFFPVGNDGDPEPFIYVVLSEYRPSL